MAGQISKNGRAKCPFVLAGKIEIERTTLCRNFFWFVHLPFFKIDVEVDAFYFFEADLKLLKKFSILFLQESLLRWVSATFQKKRWQKLP